MTDQEMNHLFDWCADRYADPVMAAKIIMDWLYSLDAEDMRWWIDNKSWREIDNKAFAN